MTGGGDAKHSKVGLALKLGDFIPVGLIGQEAAMLKRKYEVAGIDDLGDKHIFRTDDRERAERLAELMREDLEDVELSEREEA